MAATLKSQLPESTLYEWMSFLGVSLPARADGDGEDSFRNGLRDGVALCHLVNKIKPGSVENIKTRRDSGSVEDNTLRFLQACTALGVSKIFKLADLTDKKREFAPVLATLRELYGIAEGLGMGLKLCLGRGTSNDADDKDPALECEDEDEDETIRDSQESPDQIVRAKFSFMGENEDELVFEKGDIVTVTKVVEGGWWEGVCNGRVGWFPGNYVEEVPAEVLAALNPVTEKRSSRLQFYDMVINDIVESERTYTNDLQTLLTVYLTPLSSANVLPLKGVEQLTGNLPEVIRWQQGFFSSIQESSKLPFNQQNMGSVFLKAANELEALYTSYCANHPWAVNVLTDNSEILSTFMESHGAAAPGILTLTTNLSKPFRRLEKYSALLKELQHNLGEEHADAENVTNAVETYTAISARTQEVRKKKDAEHEMLTNPVQGFSGQSLADELGECQCIVQGNQALSAEDVEECFYLVFSGRLVVLAVGPSLSGYELKFDLPLNEIVIKRGTHSDSWPYPVEITRGRDTIHISMLLDRDQNLLVDTVQLQQGGHVTRAPHRTNSVTASKISMSSRSSLFRSAYPARLLRKTSAPIMRAHYWGFMSLRPAPPLKSQQLISIREKDKSPKLTKKFMHPPTKKRKSRALHEEPSSVLKQTSAEQDKGDSAILKVIEAYCAAGKSRAIAPDRHSMPKHHSVLLSSPTKNVPLLTATPTPPSEESAYSLVDDESVGLGPNSSPKPPLLPSPRLGKFGSFSTRVPSPSSDRRSEKKGFLRRRAESFDSHTVISTKKSGNH